jgi:hypothetical protein
MFIIKTRTIFGKILLRILYFVFRGDIKVINIKYFEISERFATLTIAGVACLYNVHYDGLCKEKQQQFCYQ